MKKLKFNIFGREKVQKPNTPTGCLHAKIWTVITLKKHKASSFRADPISRLF